MLLGGLFLGRMFYLCCGLKYDSIVKQLQHHFDMALFGGQMQCIEPVLSERREQTSYGPILPTLWAQIRKPTSVVLKPCHEKQLLLTPQ